MLKRWLKKAMYLASIVITVILVYIFLYQPIIQPVLVRISPIFSGEIVSFTERSRHTITPNILALAATSFIIYMTPVAMKWFVVDPYILGKTHEDYEDDSYDPDEPIYGDNSDEYNKDS